MKTAVVEKAAQAVSAPVTSAFTGENIVYMMGLSFIIGSLFTVFVLVVLDFMRRDQTK